MRRRTSILLVLAIATLSAGTGVAIAAFVATTSNSGNTFNAAAAFGGMRMATGQYTGNGVDGRAIPVPFRPDVVIVKGDTGQNAVMRSSSMAGDASKSMAGGSALAANRIQSLTATGFTVGTNSAVNWNGVSYDWVALEGYSRQMRTGSYAGSGTSQSIGGVGFSPDYVIVMPAAGQPATQRSASMAQSYRFDTTAAAPNGIASLDEDGFSVGVGSEANASGGTYHYVAWNAIPGLISEGSYAGDGVDDRSIGGATFLPDFVMVKSSTEGSACGRAVYRDSAASGDSSHHFANVADAPNFLQALEADGFQIGSDCRVNTAGTTYYWVALRGNGCPSQKTIGAGEDSWVDQANTTATHGGDATLEVTARWARVGRAFVKFPLPALPPGCAVTDARLRLHDSSPTPGRTLNVARVAAAWTEGALAWAGQPGIAGGNASATSPAGAGWMQWDVTAQVQAMYAGSNDGFRVADSNEFSFTARRQQFDSREASTNAPELVLTFG